MLGRFCILPPEGNFLPIAAESLHPDKTSPKTLPYWGNFLPIAAESLHRRVSRSPATLRHGNRDTSPKPPRCIRLWRIQRGGFQRTPAETHGFCTSFAACFTRWRKTGYTFITLRSVFDGICIGNQKAYSSGGPRQNKQSGFGGERRHSTVIDACRLRRAERYKACVDDMPFDCPLRPRAEGVEIGFYLIITDVPLCCAVCPVPT